MTREDLERWEDELKPLVPREGASPFARGNAQAFNADVDDVRAALLEPARRMLDKGSSVEHLAACLERTVAELVFWRKVLLGVHRDGLRNGDARTDFLVEYLLDARGGGREEAAHPASPPTAPAPATRS